MAEEAWYETKTVAAIDAFYSSGNTKDNLEYARRLLKGTPSKENPPLQAIIEQLKADQRSNDEFRHPVKNSPLQGPELENITRRGYLAAIGIALDRESPVPIKTFWRIWDGNEFKMLVADGVQQVSVTLLIPRDRLSGWELEHETCRESWVVNEDGPEIQTSGPPNATPPSARATAD